MPAVALFVNSGPDNWWTSPFICVFWHRHDDINNWQSQAVCVFCALYSRKLESVWSHDHFCAPLWWNRQKVSTSARLIRKLRNISKFPRWKWPTLSNCLLFLGTPVAKIGGLLTVFAFFDTSTLKYVNSVRFRALYSRNLRNVSHFVHRGDENGRQCQSVCFFGHSSCGNWGNAQTTSVFCHAHEKIGW